jgi:hypothetical protein
MRIDVQGWDFWYIAKRLFLVGVAMLVAYWIFKPGAPEKPIPPLDYAKTVYTADHAIICPLSLLSDPRADHDAAAVFDLLHLSMFNVESKAEKLGCEVVRGGIEVTAVPMGGSDNYVALDGVNFTAEIYLTNSADGSWRSADSNTAQPGSSTPTSPTGNETFDNSKEYINTTPASPIPPTNSASPSAGSLMVAISSREPILKGNVTAANTHGFGAVICPDSKTFAAYADAFIPNSDEANKKTTSDYETMRRFGCSYFPPGTSMVSEGGNPAGSLAVVTTSLPDGRTIKGVVFPNEIVQAQQPESVNQQSQVQGYNPVAGRAEAPQEPTPVTVEGEYTKQSAAQPEVQQEPVPVENPKRASPPNTDEIEDQAVALWNEKRYSEAAPFLEQACNNDRAYTCYYLGSMYNLGQGVAKDTEKGKQLLSRACSLGYERACDGIK